MNRSFRAIIAVDFKEAWRDSRLPVLLALCLILAVVAAFSGARRVGGYEAERVSAQVHDRETWLSQTAGNPHSIGHFGHMAFKPLISLAAFDPGLTPFLGTTIWQEPHWQDPANNRPAEDALDAQRFADLTPAWVLQTLAPLVVIALGFPLLARERETGMWRAVAASGLSPRKLLVAKAASLMLLSSIALAPVAIGASITPLLSNAGATPDVTLRAGGLVVTYVLYLATFGALTLAVSASAGTSRQSLATLVGIWVVAAVLAPRVGAASADLLAPVPGSGSFWAAIESEIENGFDGHASADVRRAALERRVLAQYGVQQIKDLPVSFAGIVLEEGEIHSNRIFDRHFKALYDAYERQRSLMRPGSIVSPLLAAREASQTLSGVDERHHRHFAAAAEAHRRRMISLLNADMTAHGARQDFYYLAPADLWRRIPAFRYAPPTLTEPQLAAVRTAWLALIGWLVVASASAVAGVRRWTKV